MSATSSAGKGSSVSKQRPSSFLTRKKSEGSIPQDEEVHSPQQPTDSTPPKARRPSNSSAAATQSTGNIRKIGSSSGASSGSRAPNSRSGGDELRATQSLSRISSRGPASPNGGHTRPTPDKRGNPDPHDPAATPEQVIGALRKRLHDTDRLITACQGKITEYQTKLAMFRAEKLELEMKISKQEVALKKAKFPKDTKVQVNLSFGSTNPVWAEATVIEHDQVKGTFVLVVDKYGEVDSVPEDKVRHIALAGDHEQVYEFEEAEPQEDAFNVGVPVEVNVGKDGAGKSTWSRGIVHKFHADSDTFDITFEGQGILEDVPRVALRTVPS